MNDVQGVVEREVAVYDLVPGHEQLHFEDASDARHENVSLIVETNAAFDAGFFVVLMLVVKKVGVRYVVHYVALSSQFDVVSEKTGEFHHLHFLFAFLLAYIDQAISDFVSDDGLYGVGVERDSVDNFSEILSGDDGDERRREFAEHVFVVGVSVDGFAHQDVFSQFQSEASGETAAMHVVVERVDRFDEFVFYRVEIGHDVGEVADQKGQNHDS